jgi:hypothetical protein
MVSPILRRHARHVPCTLLTLTRRTFLCHDHLRDAGDRGAATTQSVVTVASAPALRHALGQLGQARVAWWPARAAIPWEPRPWPGFGPSIVPFFFYYLNLFSDLNIYRNSIIHLKYIENGLKLRKIQSKICLNPLGRILAIDLTQLHFVHYCLLENFYESVLGVFIYKNAQISKAPNFAYM